LDVTDLCLDSQSPGQVKGQGPMGWGTLGLGPTDPLSVFVA
jgi:hypothetical protein